MMFNPNARWDRPMPQQNNSSIGAVQVCAFFDKAKIAPRFFILRNKLYKVKKINFFWQERKGEVLFNVFALETNCGSFQISFNNKNFIWKIDRVIE